MMGAMTASNRPLIHFVKSPPLVMRTVFVFAVLMFAAYAFANITMPYWASTAMTGEFTREYRYGGVLYYLSPLAFRCLNLALMGPLFLLVIEILLLPVYRDHWEWLNKQQ